MARTIWFKKQKLGQWRRNDGESNNPVTEESMYREIGKLKKDGWTVKEYGGYSTSVRTIEVFKL